MVNFFEKLEMDKNISRSVISSLDTNKLHKAKGFITDLIEFRKVKKLYDTYVTGVSKALANNGSNLIYLEYRLDGTVTGRLSNAGYDAKEAGRLGVSFHTLPRETNYNIRSYVVAPEGYQFVTADMKGMELRMLAHVAKEERMIKALQDRVDLHTYTAEMVFNKTKDQVTKEERQISKAVSFLTVYGGTEHTLALKQGISVNRAREIIEAWMDTYPGVRRYMAHVRRYMEANGHAYTIFGRKRNLQNINSIIKSVRNGAFRQGLNFTVQSPSSDTIVCGLLGLNEKLKSRKMKTKIVGTVHDSVELISPNSEVEEAINLLHLEMVTYPYVREKFDIKFRVPLELEVVVGNSFGTGEEYHLPFLDNF